MRISDWSSDVCSSDLSAIARRCGHLSGRQKLPHQCRDDREVLRTAFEEQHRRIRRQCSQTAARATLRTKEGREAYTIIFASFFFRFFFFFLRYIRFATLSCSYCYTLFFLYPFPHCFFVLFPPPLPSYFSFSLIFSSLSFFP